MKVYDLLKKISTCFNGLNIPYFVTGSIASIAYGESRFTKELIDFAYIETWVSKLNLGEIWELIKNRSR